MHRLGTLKGSQGRGLLPFFMHYRPTSLVGHTALGMTYRYQAFLYIIADVGLTFGYFIKCVTYVSWPQACSLVPVQGQAGDIFYKWMRIARSGVCSTQGARPRGGAVCRRHLVKG